jgi:hypothetical protein
MSASQTALRLCEIPVLRADQKIKIWLEAMQPSVFRVQTQMGPRRRRPTRSELLWIRAAPF